MFTCSFFGMLSIPFLLLHQSIPTSFQHANRLPSWQLGYHFEYGWQILYTLLKPPCIYNQKWISVQNCINKWGKESKQSTWAEERILPVNDCTIIFFSQYAFLELDLFERPGHNTTLSRSFPHFPWWQISINSNGFEASRKTYMKKALVKLLIVSLELMSDWTHEKGTEHFWLTKFVS